MLSQLSSTINARRRVYLLRHGDVSYFGADGQPVRTDTVRLNEAGHAQARAAADALRDVEFTEIVTSGLPRTLETAAYLAAERPVRQRIVEDLREIEPGRLGDLEEPDLESHFVRAFRNTTEPDSRFLGGETFAGHRERVLRSFVALLEETTGDLAIVAHGGTNRAIIAHALGADRVSFGALEQDPGAINIFDADSSGEFVVRLVNHSPLTPTKLGLRATTMERIYLDWVHPHRGDRPDRVNETG